ncbi:unnamed protein product, partial [Didymodactylos carnosus]
EEGAWKQGENISWNKNRIRQWLIDHSVPFIEQYSKSELLELSYAYAPEKEYIVDETAKQSDIEIVYEENFKKADQFIEQIEGEPNNDDDDTIDNDSDLTEDEDQ